jgi:hypothetical protein
MIDVINKTGSSGELHRAHAFGHWRDRKATCQGMQRKQDDVP